MHLTDGAYIYHEKIKRTDLSIQIKNFKDNTLYFYFGDSKIVVLVHSFHTRFSIDIKMTQGVKMRAPLVDTDMLS